MKKPEHDDKVLALLELGAREPMHYFEVHKMLHISEQAANQSCNRLVAQGKLRKIRNGIFQALEPVKTEP